MNGKWIKTAPVLLAVACMTGCGMAHPEKQLPAGTNTVHAEMNDTYTFENVPQSGDLAMPEQQNSAQALDAELFDDQGMQIWKGKGNTMLALKGDALYLYDMASAQVRAETKTENWDRIDFYSYRNGYCAIGNLMKGDPGADTGSGGEPMCIEAGGGDAECVCIMYDDSLHEKNRILLDDISENADVDVWSVSPDGGALVYFDLWEGLNRCDLQSRQKRNLLGQGEAGGCPDLLSINAIFFEADGSQVVFSGQTDQNGSTAASWGRIGIDGTGLENHILQYQFGTAAGYSGGRLLLGVDSISFEGGMGVVDTETGAETYNTDIKGTTPVSGPFFSDDGTVFATAALDTNQMEVSFWRTQDFSLIGREVIQDDREELFYRTPQVCLFPEFRACVVCMGGHNDIPQRTVLLNY